MSIHLQPPVPQVTLVKTEPPTLIKNEPPEETLEEEISADIKDIIYHSLSEDLIKRETVLDDVLENKHLESVQTQIKTENSPFIKTENITQINRFEDTSDRNVSRATGQEVVEVQASNGHSNALSYLEVDEKYVLNVSKNLNGISVRSRKSKSPKKTDFDECYKTDDTTVWEKEKEQINVIKAPAIPVEVHEYIPLAKGKHVCNHCQHAYKRLSSLKCHIRKMHRKVTTMYECPYCPYKSKLSNYFIKRHIILKHKDTKDIDWFQCHICEKKFKLKYELTKHKKIHLSHEQMQDGLDLKRYHCHNCGYKTHDHQTMKRHNLVHLKSKELPNFYCYHCSYKCQRKDALKNHIFRHFKNVEFKRGKRFACNKCDYETYQSANFNNHKLTHLKPEEIQHFNCYHCSYKAKRKATLKEHIFRHFKNGQVKFDCYICNFMTTKRKSIIQHIKKHSKVQNKSEINEGRKNVKQGKRHCGKCDYETCRLDALKNHKLSHLNPKEIQYFCCYHCSYKAKRKDNLKKHIFRHFKNEQVKFDCYICNFMTPSRESIIKHIKKHSKVQMKSEINEGS